MLSASESCCAAWPARSASLASLPAHPPTPPPQPSYPPPLSDPLRQRLTVRVLDSDPLKPDDLLGISIRALADLATPGEDGGQPLTLELPLRDATAKDAGSVSLTLRLLPFSELLAGEAAASSMGAPVLGAPAAAIFDSPWREMQRMLAEAMEQTDATFTPLGESPAWQAGQARWAAVAPRAPPPLPQPRVALIDNAESDTQAW